MKAVFVTNFCPHYHVKLFEMLATRMDIEFLFTSRGQEWYWDPRHGVRHGAFQHEYLAGTRAASPAVVTARLGRRLLASQAEVVFCALVGRLSLLVAYAGARAQGIPFVLWTGLWTHPRTMVHRISFPVLRAIYRGSGALVVYGSHVREYLAGLGIQREKIFVSRHALDNSLYSLPVAPADLEALRLRYSLGDRRVVLFVGRLTPIKGIRNLIEATAQIQDLRPVLLLAGDGELAQELATLGQEKGIEARFVGYVATEELYKFYALADVFALPSVTVKAGREAWGLVVNEAMNQGAPVVTSAAVGAAAGGLVRDGETGLVVPEGNATALGIALRRLLEDRSYADRLGAQGRAEIASWNNERMASAFVDAAEYAIKHG